MTSAEERRALLEAADRFVQRALAPRVERPERPMTAAALTAILVEADEIGLAGTDEEPSGLGAWEEIDTGAGPQGTLALLQRLGRANAATALALHQRALTRAVARRCGLRAPGACTITPEATHGLGRTALVRMLTGASPGDEDREFLTHVYGHRGRRILPTVSDPAGVLAPVARPDGTLRWAMFERDALQLTRHEHAHGLDELVTFEVHAVADPAGRSRLEGHEGRAAIAEAFAAHQLALVAIATGAVERAHELARQFAAERHQGGATIDRHPAVLGLLGRTRGILAQVRGQLDAAAARRLGLDAFGAAIALRSTAQPALAEAANAALQVFGGLGYMRDTGLEKILRDVNCLRALAGSPIELELMVAEWERIDA